MSRKKKTANRLEPDVPRDSSGRVIESYRRCPLCWNGRGGYGVAYSTQGSSRFYKCVKTTKPECGGACGHTWTATVRTEVVRVDHRTVTVEGQR